MKGKRLQQRLAAIVLSTVWAGAAGAQTITTTIDASKTGDPIAKHMYGQFIEHLGDPINDVSSSPNDPAFRLRRRR